MEVGGWVGPGLTQNFFLGTSSQNRPKPELIFLSSIQCVFCLYMGDSLEKGTTEGGRIRRLITNLLYTPMKKCLLNHDC